MNNELIRTLTGEVAALLRDLERDVSAAKENADSSVVIAWHVGKKCIIAKDEIGHGKYLAWLEGIGLSQPTASRYTSLATKYSTLNDLESANALRCGYLALLVPKKEGVKHEGDVSFAPVAHHNVFINAFMKWKRRVEIGKLTADRERLKEDLKPLREWLNELYA